MPSPALQNKRPVGRALIVGAASSRAQPLAAMQALGFTCAELDDPYAAASELCRRPLVYRALVLSLANLYREELGIVAMVKQRLPHVEVWLTHIEGRQAALAEAMRLGAVGLLGEDGALHRIAGTPQPDEAAKPAPEPEPAARATSEVLADELDRATEPLLSADELKALLAEQPATPPQNE